MANIILDVLPETVEIDGAEYRINSDFRISILFELLMQDDEVGKRQKLIQGLKLYYPEIPQNMTEAVIRSVKGIGEVRIGKIMEAINEKFDENAGSKETE